MSQGKITQPSAAAAAAVVVVVTVGHVLNCELGDGYFDALLPVKKKD
jgi:hypothetical protein